MISKVITGKNFYGVCRYVCMNQARAKVLVTEGIRDHDYKLMARDFETQRELRPTLTKAVFHGIISFYPGEKLPDEKMANIAKEYLEKMNIRDTQFAVVKHIDKDHLHLHIIANLIDNNGNTIKDNWIGLRGKKVAQQLTIDHGLKQADSKNLELINLHALHEKEAVKYEIYSAIIEALPNCLSLKNLEDELMKKNIEILYKYKGQTKELQGISFKKGNYKFKGSEIDRKFSIINLKKILAYQELRKHYGVAPAIQFSKKEHGQSSPKLNEIKLADDGLIKILLLQKNYEEPIQSMLIKKKKSKGRHL